LLVVGQAGGGRQAVAATGEIEPQAGNAEGGGFARQPDIDPVRADAVHDAGVEEKQARRARRRARGGGRRAQRPDQFARRAELKRPLVHRIASSTMGTIRPTVLAGAMVEPPASFVAQSMPSSRLRTSSCPAPLLADRSRV